MERITNRDIDGMLGRYARAAGREIGTKDGNLTLYGAYGRVTVRRIVGDAGGQTEVGGLGLVTKRELYNALHLMARTLEDAKHEEDERGREVDRASSASRQHFIETGAYLTRAEVAEYASEPQGLDALPVCTCTNPLPHVAHRWRGSASEVRSLGGFYHCPGIMRA